MINVIYGKCTYRKRIYDKWNWAFSFNINHVLKIVSFVVKYLDFPCNYQFITMTYKKVNFFSIEYFFSTFLKIYLCIFTLLIWFSFKNTKNSDDILLTFKSCRSKLLSWDVLSWFKVLQSKVSYFKPLANKF